MSTGPGPTHKDDGSHDASVDDIADLLVEEDPHKGVVTGGEASDDGLEVMLETPGPVLATTFLPPPPAPPGLVGEEAESLEEAGAATNLAYEDLLAKLVLPAKAPEPEPTMPAPVDSLPLPDGFGAAMAPLVHESALPSVHEPVLPLAYEPVLPSVSRPSSPNFQIAPPTEDRTLVTENPLVAEEQQAAAREGRVSVTREQPQVVQQEIPPGATEPVATANGAAKLKYLMLGGLLVLGGMILATVVLKLLLPSPASPSPVIVAPPPVPQPPPAPPAQVQPLPPTPAPAAPAQPEEAKPAAATPEETALPAQELEKLQARPHRREVHGKPVHAAAPRPAPASKTPAPAPKPAPKAAAPATAAPATAGKPAKGGKKGKGSSYADPFDN